MAVSAQQPTVHTGEHAHPSDLQYVFIALGLAFITGAEVALPYATDVEGPVLVLMLVLMVVKFAAVAMFFMHLRFDNVIFRRFFVTGIVLAASVYVVVAISMQFFGDDTTMQPVDELPQPPGLTGDPTGRNP
jgi:cytochrome c oxidase subunit IV